MARLDFEDRFTYANPGLASVQISQQTEEQLAALSAELVAVAEMVRSFSVLTKRKTLLEVYVTVTQHADPRIALILAAARDKNDQSLFPSLDSVKAAMYGPSSDTSTEFLDTERNIFVDGVRRVSAALAAAHIINQLAQIPEQHAHAKHVEQQAIEDLNRIIRVSDSSVTQFSRSDESALETSSFFFENLQLQLTDTIQVEVFLPSTGLLAVGSGALWTTVGTYNGAVNVGSIVVDIADTINQLTLVAGTANILASPILAGDRSLHRINVSARSRSPDVTYEIIIIRVTNLTSTESNQSPFRWGLSPTRIENLSVNSALISVGQGRVSSLSAAAVSSLNRVPTVLYFKRVPIDGLGRALDFNGDAILSSTWQNSNLIFRVSPTQSEPSIISIPRLLDATPEGQEKLDSLRYSQVALELLNGLFSVKGSTRALGALIRNDDPNAIDPLAGVELVSFSATNPETWIILDVLSLPADILIAVGNLQGPITQFSNKPRSIRIESRYDYRQNSDGLTPLASGSAAAPSVIRLNSSDLLNRINDQYRLFTGDCR
jgi:hypothetical protein